MRDRKRGTVRDLRRGNRAAVLWSLYLSQARSRQELSAATGLSAASVTNVVRELINEGIVVGQIASGLATVLADSDLDEHAILGVGVGVPGIIERRPEVLVHGQTYGWDAVPLGKLLRERTSLPLRFDNGAKTMGQAELWFGAGRGARNAVMILIGSGVGASLIVGGSTYRGATSSAAEFGHIAVAVGGRKCRCGAAGCLEAYAGAAAILERYGQPTAATDQELALAELISAANTSPHAAGILDDTARYLGAAIGTLINLFHPERVILGGWAGLQLGTRLLPDIRESARQHSLRHLYATTSIVLGELGPGAVALGAATLPMETFLNNSGR